MIELAVTGIGTSLLKRVHGLQMEVPSENCNLEINSLLKRTVLMGGKRLRPLLTYLMADFFGLPASKVDVCAKSIEMVHAASLSHDDVIDQATLRRGRPSINAVSSNKRAVLAGDYLLANVIGELTRQGNIRLVQEMSQIIGALAEGEWVQLDASEKRLYDESIIEQIALNKTSSIMSWCSVSPAIIANSDDHLIEKARSFGVKLGLAFQLIDDTLDFNNDGLKDAHLDLKNGIVNSVVYEWLNLRPEGKKLFEMGEDIYELFDGSELETAIKIIKAKASAYLDDCRNLLSSMEEDLLGGQDKARLAKSKKPLLQIIDYLEARKH